MDFGAKSANFPALHVRQVQNLSVHLLAFIYFGVQIPVSIGQHTMLHLATNLRVHNNDNAYF